MDANQPNYVEVRPIDQPCACDARREEAVMREEIRPLTAAWRNEQITEQELDALCRIAEDPKATTGVLDWVPRRVTQRKREPVNS